MASTTIRDHAANRPAPAFAFKNQYFLDADSGALAQCVELDHGEPGDTPSLVYEWRIVRAFDPDDETWQRRLAPIDDRVPPPPEPAADASDASSEALAPGPTEPAAEPEPAR
jgi:hypothetical protein